jgi:hypothetical protein
MKRFATQTLILFFAISVVAQDSKLPPAARDLASKLEQWEAEQKAEYDARILEKRQQVIQALNVALENATKSGDLDGALAIRNYIQSLSPSNEEPKTSGIPMPEKKEKPDHKWLIGEWIEEGKEDGNPMIIDRDGTAVHGGRGEWEIVGESLEISFLNGFKKRISLAQDPEGKISVEGISPDGRSSMWNFHRKE